MQGLSKVKILDCSLRDGGYQNAWSFPMDFVENHVKLASKCGVDAIEVGFRFPTGGSSGFRGVAAFSGDSLFDRFRDVNVPLGLMVNESDYEDAGTLRESFSSASLPSNLSFIRIATHYSRLESAFQIADFFAARSPLVFVNVMQAAKLSMAQVDSLISSVNQSAVTGVYLADSSGSMRPEGVSTYVSSLRSGLEDEISVGFHAHDNMSLALANTFAAQQAGADYLDATMRGFGRGAGNTRLEELLQEFRPQSIFSESFHGLVSLWDEDLKSESDFSPASRSALHWFGGSHGIHPNYVESLIASPEHSFREAVTVLNHISEEDRGSFDPEGLRLGRDWFDEPREIKEPVIEVFQGASVLLVAPGPSAGRYASELKVFSEVEELLVIAVGNASGSTLVPNYRAVSNPITFLGGDLSQRLDAPLIAPVSSVKKHYPDFEFQDNAMDLDFSLSEERFGLVGKKLYIPSFRSSVFALVGAESLGSERIFLAGFDGYGDNDPRDLELKAVIKRLNSHSIFAVTPTYLDLPYRGLG